MVTSGMQFDRRKGEGRETFRRPLRGHVIPSHPAHLAGIGGHHSQLSSSLWPSAHLLGALCTLTWCPLSTVIRLGAVSARCHCLADAELRHDGTESHFVYAGCFTPLQSQRR